MVNERYKENTIWVNLNHGYIKKIETKLDVQDKNDIKQALNE